MQQLDTIHLPARPLQAAANLGLPLVRDKTLSTTGKATAPRRRESLLRAAENNTSQEYCQVPFELSVNSMPD